MTDDTAARFAVARECLAAIDALDGSAEPEECARLMNRGQGFEEGLQGIAAYAVGVVEHWHLYSDINGAAASFFARRMLHVATLAGIDLSAELRELAARALAWGTS